jgi:acetyl esterase/lipase
MHQPLIREIISFWGFPQRCVALGLMLLAAAPALAQTAPANTPLPAPFSLPPGPTVPGIVVPLWPDGKMPGHGANQPEGEKPRAGNIQRIINVSRPILTVFQAPASAGPTPAIVISPGGGYGILAYDLEGTEVAGWLNSLGITAILLKYRVPNNRDGAFQDIQRAFRLTRLHAAEWNIQPDKVGGIGFSAGGNLTARLSNDFGQASYPPIDSADALSCRPDFVILVYPAYLEVKGVLAPDMNITAQTSQTLIVHTESDKIYVPGSKIYDAALTAANVPHAFLLYHGGGHGWGLRSKADVKIWPSQAADWLRKIGVLPSAP